jgi:methyl-accepting chemotaxis protein
MKAFFNNLPIHMKFHILLNPILVILIGITVAYGLELEEQGSANAIWVWLIGIYSVFHMLIIGLGGVYFPLVQRAGKLVTTLEKVQSEKDLTVRFDCDANDELGRISKAVNSLIISFDSSLSKIGFTGEKLADGAKQASTATQDCQGFLEAQQSESGQLAAAVTQMTATSQEIASRTSDTADSAMQAQQLTNSGADTVKDSTASVVSLADDVTNLGGIISNLATRAQEVGGVLEVIKSVAEQTNLLALNAAIEAARAGEQGRGFAVVADEVRTLASRTQESAEEITGIVTGVSGESEHAAKVVQACMEHANQTVDKVSGLSALLADIEQSASVINDMAAQIATASEEQVQTNEEISRNVVRVDDMTSQCVSKISALTEIADGNNLLSDDMSQIATSFHCSKH